MDIMRAQAEERERATKAMEADDEADDEAKVIDSVQAEETVAIEVSREQVVDAEGGAAGKPELERADGHDAQASVGQ